MKTFPHLGAFESTKIHGSGLDVLDTTRHAEFWQDDLLRIKESGIQQLRYPVPWHRIERNIGEWDWSWMEGPVRWMRELGLQPILDPLHHVSVSDWLVDGFAHPEFTSLYVRFLEKIEQRYEWVESYTIVNEPLPTLPLCALIGVWYPYRISEPDFVSMATNLARAICLGTLRLQKANPRIRLIHVDACEQHRALDTQTVARVEHLNHRRFLFHDLMFGRVAVHHPLLPYLLSNGFTERYQRWFEDHPVFIDTIGLDYYAHSEMEWVWNGDANRPIIQFPCQRAHGFAAVGRDYVRRFRLPVILAETNIGGTVTDRLTWLKLMEEQAETLAETCDFRGFCWFPSIDSTDSNSLCTLASRFVCPMGIWSLAEDCGQRSSSELSEWYSHLAQGKACSRDLPASRFEAPLNRNLEGYEHLMGALDELDRGSPISQALATKGRIDNEN